MKLRTLITEALSPQLPNEFNSNIKSWNEPVVGKLTQNGIRDIFKTILGSNMFGTAANDWYKQLGKDVLITVDISNANIELITITKLRHIAAELGKSAGLPVEYYKLVKTNHREDMSSYEPGKFSSYDRDNPGTYNSRFANIQNVRAKFKIKNCTLK